MCGRYVQASSPQLLAERFAVDEVRDALAQRQPDYNVTPRRELPVVAVSEDHRVLDLVRWGLVPSWAKELKVGDRMINARAETIKTKPAFRSAFKRRRCIVPSDGFYEWKRRPDRPKQPFFIHRVDREPMAFAGVWERWRDPHDESAPWIRTFAIITTDANDLMSQVHDRMPVILPEAVWAQWLDPANEDTDALESLLVPEAAGDLALHPVSTRVNRPSNNDLSLLEAVEAND